MKKQIQIKVPTDYSAISLKRYIQIQKDLENNRETEDIQNAYLLYNFCGLTPDVVTKLDTETINSILNDLKGLLNKTDYELQRFIKLGEIEYGIEPNLSKMSYGAYLDISHNDTIGLDENWGKVLSVIYRPVKRKRGLLYELEPYKGFTKKDTEKWLEVNMDFHFGVFFYFLGLYKALVTSILNSMKNHQEITPNIKSVLEKSGELIQQLFNSQGGTSSSLMK